jgi:hypothetical protein
MCLEWIKQEWKNKREKSGLQMGKGLQELGNEELETQGEWRRAAPVVKRDPCRTFRE